jgi:PAS domain S-box-containing protein
MDSISDGVYCLNTDGYFIYVNNVILKRSGISRDQFYTSHFLDLVAPEFHEQAKINFQQVMKGAEGSPYELRYKSFGGQIRIVEVHSRPIHEGGKIVGLLGVSRDITDRTRAEEVLKKSEEKYYAILENASDAILLADTQGNLLEANRKAEELWGYSKEELLQMHYTQLHPMLEMERTIAAFKEIIEKKIDHLRGGFIQRKDGNILPVDITGTVIEYAGKKVIQGSFRDISTHKHKEDTLERLVLESTKELSEKNKQLILEIRERKNAEATLRQKKNELTLHAGKLQEMNMALKVLLKQRQEDKTELEEKVMANVKELVLPYLEELKRSRLDAKGNVQVSILEANLKSIVSPFTQRLSTQYSSFTPREIQVANLIRQGKSTKDIAELMGISRNAINIYRNHIRNKLGIITKKINLRSHLMGFS